MDMNGKFVLPFLPQQFSTTVDGGTWLRGFDPIQTQEHPVRSYTNAGWWANKI